MITHRGTRNVIRFGNTRTVVTFGPWAFKLGRGRVGVRCNRHEACLFRRVKLHRRSMLCPVLWCSWPAIVLVMRRAETPVSQDQVDERIANAWSEWDYLGDQDDGCPFEWKRSDWGVLDGKLVAVDYAATVAVDCATAVSHSNATTREGSQ